MMTTASTQAGDEAQIIRGLLDDRVAAIRARTSTGRYPRMLRRSLCSDLAPPLQFVGADEKAWPTGTPCGRGRSATRSVTAHRGRR